MAEKNIYSEAESMSENLPKVSVFAVSTENLDIEKALSDYSELISQARMKKIKRLAHLDKAGQKSVSYRALCRGVSFRLVVRRGLRSLRDDRQGGRGREARSGEGRYGAPFAWNREFRPV